MRRCKNCGRLFVVAGHAGTERCDHPADEKGRTCKEIGAFRVCEKNRSKNEAFKVLRREYKKQFAWIRAGKITRDEFYVWSEQTGKSRMSVTSKKSHCQSLWSGRDSYILRLLFDGGRPMTQRYWGDHSPASRKFNMNSKKVLSMQSTRHLVTGALHFVSACYAWAVCQRFYCLIWNGSRRRLIFISRFSKSAPVPAGHRSPNRSGSLTPVP